MLKEEAKKVPTPAQALEDDEARSERQRHGEGQLAKVPGEFRADTPKEMPKTIPFDQQRGRRPAPTEAAARPIEENPAALARVQDPYNERKTRPPGKRVWVRDSYGNVVKMPV